MTPGISVVIPAHPARARPPATVGQRVHRDYLNQALRSVNEQTRLPDAVHIAIDNQRAGAPVTRQRALDAVTTTWVAFLDSDDMFLPRHLELLEAHALDTGADYVYSWFKILQEDSLGRERLIDWDGEKGDGVFPPGHFLNEFDPANPIETTITVLVRTELAQQVGMRALDRGHHTNTGEDHAFTIDCLAAGASIKHLRRFTWIWRHHWVRPGVMGNTSGHATKGDAA